MMYRRVGNAKTVGAKRPTEKKGIPGFGGRFFDDPQFFQIFFWSTFFGGRLVSHSVLLGDGQITEISYDF